MGLDMDVLTNHKIKTFGGVEEDFATWLISVEARIAAAGIDLTKPLKPAHDASVFSFLLSTLEGHPLFIATSGNDKHSGTFALNHIKERYLPSSQDHSSRLQQDLANLSWSSADTVDSFMGRLVKLDEQLRRYGIETPLSQLHAIIRRSIPKDLDLAMRFLLMEATPPSISKITATLLAEERLNSARKDKHPATTALVISTNNNSNSNSGTSATTSHQSSKQQCCPSSRRSLTCNFCGLSNHCAQECFKLKAARRHGLINVEDILKQLRDTSGKRRFNNDSRSSSTSNKRNASSFNVMACLTDNDVEDTVWYIDTGASYHITGNKHLFSTFTTECNVPPIHTANGEVLSPAGSGSVVLHIGDATLELHDVVFIPDIKYNLIAGGKVATMPNSHLHVGTDSYLSINDTIFKLKHTASNHLHLTAETSVSNNKDATVMVTTNSDQQPNKHHTLGHRGLVRCVPCTLAKSTKTSINHQSAPRTAQMCKLLYADIAGPLEVESIRGFTYAILFIDDATRFVWTFLIKHKSDAVHALSKLRFDSHMRDALQGATLQTDSDAVFKGEQFREACLHLGVKQRFSPPHSQAMNGSAERTWRSLFETTRALLFASSLPKEYWGFALKHATLLNNIRPRTGLNNMSPFMMLEGHDFDTEMLREFGSPAYVHKEKQQRGKLDPRAREGIYVGYSEEDISHVIFMLDNHRVLHSIHVDFGELPSNTSDENDADVTKEPAQVPVLTEHHDDDVDPLLTDFDAEHDSDDDYDDAAVVVRRAGEKTATVAALTVATEPTTSHTTAADPVTSQQALSAQDSEEWIEAIKEEMTAMERLGVFEPVDDRHNQTSVVGSRFVFTRKRDKDGRVVRHKVRLVAKGFTQHQDIDYSETFAPTVTITSLRLMMGVAVNRGMVMKQADISTAYLNADLDVDLMLKLPKNNGVYPEGTIVRLRKAIYGLKQSGRLWNATLDAWLRHQGFQRCETDPCLYRRNTSSSNLIMIAVYVDDLLIVADTQRDMDDFEKEISAKFAMKPFDDPHVLLGVNINYDRKAGTLTMDQSHYITNMLTEYGMDTSHPIGTPMATNYKDAPADPKQDLPKVPFRALIGSLLFASTRTRPDIATAVGILSRHMTHYNQDHWVAAKHILRYLRGTRDAVLMFRKDTSEALHGYADATYASDTSTSRSRTGYVLYLAHAPIAWVSRLQKTIASSSAESEYQALASAAQEILFLRQLLSEMIGGDDALPPTLLHCDNQPSIRVADRCSTTMRHVRIRFHLIRQLVEEGVITLTYCNTSANIADIFTKPLPKPKHLEFCSKLLA